MKKMLMVIITIMFVFSFSVLSFASPSDRVELPDGFEEYIDNDDSYKHTSIYFQNGYYSLPSGDYNIKAPNYSIWNLRLPDMSCIFMETKGDYVYFHVCYINDNGYFMQSDTWPIYDGCSSMNGYFCNGESAGNVGLSSQIYTDCRPSIVGGNVIAFSTLDSAKDYLINGNLDTFYTKYIPHSFNTEAPLTMFVYQSDTNEYDLTLNWTQLDISDDIRSYVTLDIELLANNVEKKLDTVVLDAAYQTKKDNYVQTNVSTYMEGIKLVNFEDYVEFGFTVYNYPLTGNGIKSKPKHCYVYWTNHGIFYNENNLINAEDIDDKGVKLPTETEYIQSGGIINMEDWYNSGSGSGNFLSGIFSGFGLLDGSLPAFISSTFSYVPDELWILIFAAVSGALVVGLFKLVVK